MWCENTLYAGSTSLEPETPESGEMTGALPPCPIIRGSTGAEVLFHNSIIGHFMVYKDRLETKLLHHFSYYF